MDDDIVGFGPAGGGFDYNTFINTLVGTVPGILQGAAAFNNGGGGSFTPYTGPVVYPGTGQGNTTPAPAASNNTVLYIVIAVLALLIILAAAYFLIRKK